jgi:hypothetical protein
MYLETEVGSHCHHVIFNLVGWLLDKREHEQSSCADGPIGAYNSPCHQWASHTVHAARITEEKREYGSGAESSQWGTRLGMIL